MKQFDVAAGLSFIPTSLLLPLKHFTHKVCFLQYDDSSSGRRSLLKRENFFFWGKYIVTCWEGKDPYCQGVQL